MPGAGVEVCRCGLAVPPTSLARHAYINANAGCWGVYGEVLAREYGDMRLMRDAHQYTVDGYTAQHPGGPHPDKSVDIHLVGLHLLLDRGVPDQRLPALRQHLADSARDWPHFEAPADLGLLRIDSVRDALPETHVEAARAYATSVWAAWAPRHPSIVALAEASGVVQLAETSRG